MATEWEKKQAKQVNESLAEVGNAFDKTAKDAVRLASSSSYTGEDGKMFSFSDAKLKRKADKIVRAFAKSITGTILQGNEMSWANANEKNDALVDKMCSVTDVPKSKVREWSQRNLDALQEFNTRVEDGMSLSARVWNLSSQYRAELEMAISIGIGEGKSAAQISRDVRQYLRYPDKLFRRVRDKFGNLQLSKAAKAFHPGRGVYRSSYKNALRLTATENNMAYRSADYERWKQTSYVLGIKISLSASHPVPDICDTLQGIYPKTFKFRGWHPWCRCFATPILPTQKKFFEGLEKDLDGAANPYGSPVQKMPTTFMDWYADNKARLAVANTLPYFIRDNEALITGQKPKRTAEQEAKIREKWAARQKKNALILKGALNIFKVAQDYSEVSYTGLQQAIQSRDTKQMAQQAKIVAKQIAEVRAEEKALADLIPNVHQWHKTFSLEELKQAHAGLKKGVAKLNTKSTLQEAKKWLLDEIEYVENPYKFKQHTIYPTYKIAQEFYAKELSSIELQLKQKDIEQKLDVISQWSAKHPKAVVTAKLLQEAEQALYSGQEISVLEEKYAAVEKEYNRKLREQKWRDKKKAKNKKQDISFDDDCFTQERKDNAVWNRTAKQADNYFHDNAVEFWKKLTYEEKEALWGYTGGSGYITRLLRAIPGYEYDYLPSQSVSDKHIKAMTTALNKQTLKDDVWLKRDAGSWNIDYIFNVKLNDFANNPKALVGKVGLEESFQSCGSCRETRFTCTGTKDVILNIYCPKGTPGAYAEPWSSCGTYGKYWNGTDKANPSSRSENEVLLQRGAQMRITKAEYTKGMWYIDVEILGFDIREYEMATNANGFYCEFK